MNLGVRLRALASYSTLFACFPAYAAPFVPATGKIDLDGAQLGQRLDGPSPEVPILVYDVNFRPLTPAAVAGQFETDPAAAIEGEGSFLFGGASIYGYLDVRSLTAQLAGRRIEIRIWQRARGTAASFSLQWYSGPLEELFRGQRTGHLFLMADLPFQPTGRATDDGWQEWSTGPVDADLGGKLQAQVITLFDDHLRGSYSGVGDYDPDVRVALDALSIEDLGPAAIPDRTCSLVTEADRCGPEGACYFGRCADAAAVLGPRLEAAELRRQYLERRIFELTSFEGGRAPLSRMDQLRAALTALEASGTTHREYWDAMVRAVMALGDGHASAPYPSSRSSFGTSMCLHLGEADRLPSGGTAPLVFEVAPASPFGAHVSVGDALVAIDALPVDEWTERAKRFLHYGGDPAAASVINAPALFQAALTTGATLSFARCPTSSTATVTCSHDELEAVEISMAAEVSSLWDNQVPAWRTDDRFCDFRFRRPVSGARVREYDFADFADREGARWVLINGVPSKSEQFGQQWFDAIDAAFAPAPARIVLDQRLGQGGSMEAVDRLGTYLLGLDEFWAMDLLPQHEGALTPQLLNGLRGCSLNGSSRWSSCGAYMIWRLGDSSGLLPRGGAADARLAILNSADVSGNDYVSKLLTFRRRGATRIFGPAPTFGAFGVIWQLPAYAGELLGGSFQVHDTLFVAAQAGSSSAFTTSTGVAPDEVVLQKQSDLLRGVDTLMARAAAWVSQ